MAGKNQRPDFDPKTSHKHPNLALSGLPVPVSRPIYGRIVVNSLKKGAARLLVMFGEVWGSLARFCVFSGFSRFFGFCGKNPRDHHPILDVFEGFGEF